VFLGKAIHNEYTQEGYRLREIIVSGAFHGTRERFDKPTSFMFSSPLCINCCRRGRVCSLNEKNVIVGSFVSNSFMLFTNEK